MLTLSVGYQNIILHAVRGGLSGTEVTLSGKDVRKINNNEAGVPTSLSSFKE